MKKLYIQTGTTEKTALLMDGDHLEHFFIDRSDQASLVGNIYAGRIRRVDHGLQAAFVDIGQKKLSFLPKKEIPAARKGSGPIEHYVHEGMNMIVQVTKDAYDQKGSRVTANVTVPGRYFIYMPYSSYWAASKRINQEEKLRVQSVVEGSSVPSEGAIIRTSALQADQEELEKEWLRLREKWEKLYHQAKSFKKPALLFADREIPERVIRKYATPSVEEIIFDDIEAARAIKQDYPYAADQVRWTDNLDKEMPLSVHQAINHLTQRAVRLTSGIELIIERTEALTVIDVNTAKFKGGWTKERTVLGANIEAAREAARQIKLRNLSGMILVDFISMKNKQDEQRVLAEMKKQAKQDSVYCEVLGFTRLGILELTRKREGMDVPSLVCEPQEISWTPQAHAYQLERELCSYRKKDCEAFLVEVRPDVFDAFINHVHIRNLSERMKTPIYLKKNPLETRGFVIKFIGDLKWLERSHTTAIAIDKFI
ncbi:Rne/Rng family ribonuclease [Virgibacillus sp. MSP4-1]|uniref:Rne/Rng family ribonuclease n=1 Tax=Virgibacillus sp. MSP4-1 TaxID=2700081 RepID=UPI00137BA254|nr:Rne/Rng family ribonuclease [Virgibacillus sp. MSP4-1]QHS22900.1 Rne/Rng family ribonuclease [Virgibacillus sp. MSP4-1]